MEGKRIIKKLRYPAPGDWVNISFLVILSIIDLLNIPLIKTWYLLVPLNFIIILIIFLSAASYEKQRTEKNNEENFSLLKLFRYWYTVPLILFIFKQVYWIIYYVKPADIDSTLISIDYRIFGVNPTHWAFQFANPFLTEFLQIIYVYYYIMILVYGLELYLWKRYPEYKYALFIIVTGFYISYIVYMIYPAVGPRFTLHEFYSINKELPGLFLTDKIRGFLDFCESIPAGVLNPITFTQRDAMPSAHISLAILIAYLSRKIKSRSFYFYLPYCFLMAAATIYLRYHYVIDLAAGAVVAVITIMIGKLVFPLKKSYRLENK